MGAWDHFIFSNDYVLDEMYDVEKDFKSLIGKDIDMKDYLLHYIDGYIHEDSEDIMVRPLLGVGFALCALTGNVEEAWFGGFYDYDYILKAFADIHEKLTGDDLKKLQDKIVNAVTWVKENENPWFPQYRQGRYDFLDSLIEDAKNAIPDQEL